MTKKNDKLGREYYLDDECLLYNEIKIAELVKQRKEELIKQSKARRAERDAERAKKRKVIEQYYQNSINNNNNNNNTSTIPPHSNIPTLEPFDEAGYIRSKTYNKIKDITYNTLPRDKEFIIVDNVFTPPTDNQLDAAQEFCLKSPDLIHKYTDTKKRHMRRFDLTKDYDKNIFESTMPDLSELHTHLHTNVLPGRTMEHTVLTSKPGCGVQQFHIDIGPMLQAKDTLPEDISFVILYSLQANTHMWIKDKEKIIRLSIPPGMYMCVYMCV